MIRAHRHAAVVCAGVLLSLAASPARAYTGVSEPNSSVQYSDPENEANRLLVTQGPSDILFDDTVPLFTDAPANFCTQDGDNVRCPIPREGLDRQLVLEPGPGDDRVDVVGVTFLTLMSDGSGNDTMVGGAEPDVFFADQEADDLHGGGGVDQVDMERTYVEPAPDAAYSLDDLPNDGPLAASGDNAHSDIEDVLTGNGNDRITGSAAANHLVGRAGNDVIDGAAGTDVLDAGAGDDTVSSRDGVPDQVTCGAGTDVAIVDQLDAADGCEDVRSAFVAPPGAPAPTPGTGPAAPAPGHKTAHRLRPRRLVVHRRGSHVRGLLLLPRGVTRARGCSGRVTVRLRSHRRSATRSARLTRRCTWSVRMPFAHGRLTARFGGNVRLTARAAP